MNAQNKRLALLQKISGFSDKRILTDVRGQSNTEAPGLSILSSGQLFVYASPLSSSELPCGLHITRQVRLTTGLKG